MTPQQELDQVWDMLARAMSVIDDLIEGIQELEGPQE